MISPGYIPSGGTSRSDRSVWCNINGHLDPQETLNHADSIVTEFGWRRMDTGGGAVRTEPSRDGHIFVITEYRRSFVFGQSVQKRFTETPDSIADGEGSITKGIFYPDWAAWAVLELPAVAGFDALGTGWQGAGHNCSYQDQGYYIMKVELHARTKEVPLAVTGSTYAIKYELPSVTAAVWKEISA